MAEPTAPGRAATIPRAGKVLCATYAVISMAALVATWSQNVACFDRPARFLAAFLEDSKTTPASRSLTVDILLFFLAAAVLADTLALAAFAIAVAARTIRVDAG
ncbi:MAG: DUF2834 domain-containing protein [Mycobacterium sp.]|jgi:hypothetical protein|uniref:DUF2834 domain-containing protein n=1 Tax=Mycobacterium sp. TaxID=1785 RepID=UPI00284BB0E5|nr:DUF2834 domain-containing protein [Mycobacterium sp.]HKI39842.1 DUF2834 domain-containing protein [Mycobacterium sp.]